jgi:G3E family GTPase
MLPVTLVAGWLDDGAAVLGQRMAANTPGAAILHAGLVGVGAAGEVIALEEEIAHRSPGCPCCAVRLDLLDWLGLLARRREPPSHAVVVGALGTDLGAAAVTILDDPALRRGCRLDGVVACVPGKALSAAVAARVEDPWPSPALLEAVLLADVVWITDAAELTVDGLRMASRVVRSVNPTAAIDATRSPDVERLLQLRSWSPEAAARQVERLARATHPAGIVMPTGATLLSGERPLDADRVERFLAELRATAGSRLLRLDAVFAIEGDDRRQLVQGCRSALRVRPGRAWADDEVRRSQVSIVARDLDVEHLAPAFAACAA